MMQGPGAVSNSRQRGLVLVLALVFLLLLGLLASGLMQTSMLEFRMSTNAQSRELSLQQAQAIVDELSTREANFTLAQGVGYTVCGSTGSCDAAVLTVSEPLLERPEGVELHYAIQRQPPLIRRGLPLREPEGVVSSARAYDAALFETTVSIDGEAARVGSVRLAQGIAVRVARPVGE